MNLFIWIAFLIYFINWLWKRKPFKRKHEIRLLKSKISITYKSW
jgi:hypothetical protein